MKTIIKTTIKDNTNIQVNENVNEVYKELVNRGNFVLLTRISNTGATSTCVLRKSSIKMVKEL